MLLHNDNYFDSQMIIIIISYAIEEEKMLGGRIDADDDKFTGMKIEWNIGNKFFIHLKH